MGKKKVYFIVENVSGIRRPIKICYTNHRKLRNLFEARKDALVDMYSVYDKFVVDEDEWDDEEPTNCAFAVSSKPNPQETWGGSIIIESMILED